MESICIVLPFESSLLDALGARFSNSQNPLVQRQSRPQESRGGGMKCQHQHFNATVKVIHLEDTGRYTTDIRIVCTQCELPFHFLGLPCGSAYDRPMVSADACELRAPIAPGRGDLPSKATFVFPELPKP